MKGSGPPVATVLVASTVALTSSSSAKVQHVSFSPTSSNQVDMVIVPATTGQMGVLPGHVATIAEFKPDIITVKAVPLDRINANLVQKRLVDFTQKLS
ncbi:hypothetical protein V6Z12_A03G213700 [Gossypium hirsutum]